MERRGPWSKFGLTSFTVCEFRSGVTMANGPSRPSNLHRARPFSRRYSPPGALRNVKRVSDARQLARFSGLQLKEAMRGRAILVLLGLTAFGAYSAGRQSAPVSNAPVGAASGLYRPGR